MAAVTQRIYKPDGNKKDVGKCSVRAYPRKSGLRIAPMCRISNESLPTSADIYAYTTTNVEPNNGIDGYTYPLHPIYAKIVHPYWRSTPYYI